MTTATSLDGLAMSVNLMPTGPVSQVVELAREAESLGYDRCWAYDEGLVTRDVYVVLTAIAAATETIRIGPGITNPFVRHPGATAAAIASLDEVSGGRAYLGLGAGGGLTLNPLAIERRRPLRAVEDMIMTVRALLAGDTVSHDGEAFSFDRAKMSYGRPDIEILVAGRGPKMMELGARLADGFYVGYVHKELLGAAVGRLRRTAGDRAFTIVYSTMVATTDADLEEARAQLSFRLVDSPPEVRELIGMTDADEGALRAALADGGPAAAANLVDPDWVPQFVIAGTPDECRTELATIVEQHRIDEFMVPVADLDAGPSMIEVLRSLG